MDWDPGYLAWAGRFLRRALTSPLWVGLGGAAAIISVLLGFLALPVATPIRGAIVTVASGHSATPASTAQLMPTETPMNPTDTPVVPTETPLIPTPTVLVLATPTTIPENIRLQCDSCSDAIVVTVTQIQIQPDQNNMVWTLNLYNNSQDGTYSLWFDPFTLTLNGSDFSPTGPLMTDEAPELYAGKSMTQTLTFSFVPYTAVSYTLTSHLHDGIDYDGVDFNPVGITF